MDDRTKPQSILRHLNQEKIVFILTIVLFILFSIILPNFLAANNILLVFDKVVFPTTVDLLVYRDVTAFLSALVLVAGLAWDGD